MCCNAIVDYVVICGEVDVAAAVVYKDALNEKKRQAVTVLQ